MYVETLKTAIENLTAEIEGNLKDRLIPNDRIWLETEFSIEGKKYEVFMEFKPKKNYREDYLVVKYDERIVMEESYLSGVNTKSYCDKDLPILHILILIIIKNLFEEKSKEYKRLTKK